MAETPPEMPTPFTPMLTEDVINLLQNEDVKFQFEKREIIQLLKVISGLQKSISENTASFAWQNNGDDKKAAYYLEQCKLTMKDTVDEAMRLVANVLGTDIDTSKEDKHVGS